MNHRRNIVSIVISMMVLSSLLVLATNNLFVYAQDEIKFKAKLTGKNVVPPVNSTAAGRAIIFVGSDELKWKLNVTGITDPTSAHFHMGKKGENGSIIADLLKSAKIKDETDRTIMTGTITAADLQGPMQDKSLQYLQSAFNNATVNIDLHTKNNPNGELRGTIKIQGGSANTTTSASTQDN